jgi:hypothetical protein
MLSDMRCQKPEYKSQVAVFAPEVRINLILTALTGRSPLRDSAGVLRRASSCSEHNLDHELDGLGRKTDLVVAGLKEGVYANL